MTARGGSLPLLTAVWHWLAHTVTRYCLARSRLSAHNMPEGAGTALQTTPPSALSTYYCTQAAVRAFL